VPERCEVQLEARRLGPASEDPEAGGMLMLRRLRINGAEVPVPRGARVRLEGEAGTTAARLTISMLPTTVELVPEEEW
jgi:hypothetical protein